MFFSVDGQEDQMLIGDKFYNYSKALSESVNSIGDLRLLDYDIHCVHINKVEDSQIPKVDFLLTDDNRKMLYGYDDGMLVWKGAEGPDPFLGIEGKYFQFKKGVPTYNFIEPSDFENSGDLSIYLEYKVNELPEDLNIWCTLMEYDRIKVKVKVDYNTSYVTQYDYPFSEVVNYELSRKVVFEVIDFKARKTEEWIEFNLDAHPSLPTYFKPVVLEEVILADTDNPLGKIVLTTSPENKVVFSSKSPMIELPECNDSELQVYVYPNPSFGDVTVRLEDNGFGPYTFELYNAVGHPLFKESFNSSGTTMLTKFNLSNLNKGIYLYGIIDSRGVILQTKRLVIVKR